jgi:hypothetical protein
MRALAVAVLRESIAPFTRGHVEREPAVAAPPLLGVDTEIADQLHVFRGAASPDRRSRNELRRWKGGRVEGWKGGRMRGWKGGRVEG